MFLSVTSWRGRGSDEAQTASAQDASTRGSGAIGARSRHPPGSSGAGGSSHSAVTQGPRAIRSSGPQRTGVCFARYKDAAARSCHRAGWPWAFSPEPLPDTSDRGSTVAPQRRAGVRLAHRCAEGPGQIPRGTRLGGIPGIGGDRIKGITQRIHPVTPFQCGDDPSRASFIHARRHPGAFPANSRPSG